MSAGTISTATFRQCRLAGRDGLAPGLLGGDDHLAIDAAALVSGTEIDLLDRLEPNVLPNDLGCDQDDRHAIAMGLVEPVDEVKAAGAATAGAGCQIAGELCLGSRPRRRRRSTRG
jgi:hypothetical protein